MRRPTVVAIPGGRYRKYYGGGSGKTLSAIGSRVDNPKFGSATVISAASARQTTLAPDSIASVYGVDMTSDPASTVVNVNGLRAVVLYASASQVNFVVPGSASWRAAHVIVTSRDGRQSTAVGTVRNVAPGAFTARRLGDGRSCLDAVSFIPGPFPVGQREAHVALFGTGIRRARQVEVKVGGGRCAD